MFTGGDSLLDRVYRWEREQPRRIFLTQPSRGEVRNWTWEQALGEARRMAAYLNAQGWAPGSRVAIMSANCAWWIMADLAIWMAGHVTVPVFPSLRAESVRQILDHSGASACFVGKTDEKQVSALGIPERMPRIYFPTAPQGSQPGWDAVVASQAAMPAAPPRRPEDLATIIYTSGTTGSPKGASHSLVTLGFDAARLCEVLGLGPRDRVFSYLPLAHIFERTALECTAFHAGMRVFFNEGLETFLTDIRRARPVIFLSVPRLLTKLQQGVFQKMPREKLEGLLRMPLVNWLVRRRVLRGLGLGAARYAASGAAPLPLDVLTWYRRLGLDLAEGYGMTEILITHLGRHGRVRPGFVGEAVEGVELKLGDNGELLVKSPANMLGYYRDPEATRQAFTEDGFFRTGDIAVIEGRQIRIVGRIKEQFKTSKGKYVVPGAIEGRLASHPDIEACCLMGSGQPSPFAVVLLSPEAHKRCSDPTEKTLLEQSLGRRMEEVNAGLEPHERLSFIAVAEGPWTVANGMVTPTMKIKRAVLEERYEPLIEEWEREERRVVWEADRPPASATPEEIGAADQA